MNLSRRARTALSRGGAAVAVQSGATRARSRPRYVPVLLASLTNLLSLSPFFPSFRSRPRFPEEGEFSFRSQLGDERGSPYSLRNASVYRGCVYPAFLKMRDSRNLRRISKGQHVLVAYRTSLVAVTLRHSPVRVRSDDVGHSLKSS